MKLSTNAETASEVVPPVSSLTEQGPIESTGAWEVWAHEDVAAQLAKHSARVQRKAQWAEVQLAMMGRTIRWKTTQGHDCAWRRTPIGDHSRNEFYLWWVPAGCRGTPARPESMGTKAIWVRAVRHHDDTGKLLAFRPDDFQPLDVAGIDPRIEDQRELATGVQLGGEVAPRVVMGQPGSGKTIALLYAMKDLLTQDPSATGLYVTYTRNLATMAAEFAAASGISPRLKIFTFTGLVNRILDSSAEGGDVCNPPDEYRGFEQMARRLPVEYKAWRDSPKALWAEVRAFLIGMALPYSWRRGSIEIPAAHMLGLEKYREVRRGLSHSLGSSLTERAYRLAERALNEGLVMDLHETWQAVDRLTRDRNLVALPDVDAIAVDEIQDLTPVQIALVSALAETRDLDAKRRQRRPVLLLAGDESQTVQPSGFYWPITKDVLTKRLGAPIETELTYQMRCPRRLFQLLEATFSLYEPLSPREKGARPHTPAQRMEPADAFEDVTGGSADEDSERTALGQVFTCQARPEDFWGGFFDAIRRHVGIAIVCLDEGSDCPPEIREKYEHAIFRPKEVKGLDRRTVIVWGAGEALLKLRKLPPDKPLTPTQTRQIVDAFRVAVSRATETVVLMDGTCSAEAQAELAKLVAPVDGSRCEYSIQALADYLCAHLPPVDELLAEVLQEIDEFVASGRLRAARGRLEAALAQSAALLSPDGLTELRRQERRLTQLEQLEQLPAMLQKFGPGTASLRLREIKTASQGIEDGHLERGIEAAQANVFSAIRRDVLSRIGRADARMSAGDYASARRENSEASKVLACAGDAELDQRLQSQALRITAYELLERAQKELDAGRHEASERLRAEIPAEVWRLGDSGLDLAQQAYKQRLDTFLASQYRCASVEALDAARSGYCSQVVRSLRRIRDLRPQQQTEAEQQVWEGLTECYEILADSGDGDLPVTALEVWSRPVDMISHLPNEAKIALATSLAESWITLSFRRSRSMEVQEAILKGGADHLRQRPLDTRLQECAANLAQQLRDAGKSRRAHDLVVAVWGIDAVPSSLRVLTDLMQRLDELSDVDTLAQLTHAERAKLRAKLAATHRLIKDIVRER